MKEEIKEKLNNVVCQSASDYEELNEVYKYIEELEKEKQELIDYLKQKIKERNKDIKLIGKDVYTSKYAYEEMLSKLVKIDQIEKE